jgi:Spx/MgsR family transcriptional regulator
MYIIYGIPNCDTVKKTVNWLNVHKIKFHFHNYKTDGITKSKLKTWCNQKGWNVLLNKKSSTWRGLDEATQKSIVDEKTAIALMLESTSLIKRPVIEVNETVLTVGFDASVYEAIFLKKVK